MKKRVLYSRARRSRTGASPFEGRSEDAPWLDDFDQGPSPFAVARAWTRGFYARHDRILLMAVSILVSLALVMLWNALHPPPRVLTQTDIDGAVKYTLNNLPPQPAITALAADKIAPSVVKVEGYLSPEHAAELEKKLALEQAKARHASRGKKNPEAFAPPDATTKKDGEAAPDSIGSGVIIDERGSILTNLHVISSTDRWVVIFADGSKSDATLVGTQPENDLAVIKASKLPDDMQPAVLASTRGLNPGDQVVAVGFPFGIGPSTSAGVVSGLKREFVDHDKEDKPKLTNLIQFDAAVNPGNSGGPLVNRDGEVVGIVTAIFNPSGNRTFAGLGFAVPIENAARAAGENPL